MDHFLSIAWRWESHPELTELAEEVSLFKPIHHDLVDVTHRHCTLFAIAKFIEKDGKEPDPTEMRSILSILPRKGIEEILVRHLRSACFLPIYWTTYDNATTFQFESLKLDLSQMRTELRSLLRPILYSLEWDKPLQPMLEDKLKSRGGTLFGSLARAPGKKSPGEPSRKPFKKLVEVWPKSAEITVSNDTLSNQRTENEDYFVVHLDQANGYHSA